MCAWEVAMPSLACSTLWFTTLVLSEAACPTGGARPHMTRAEAAIQRAVAEQV